ncbi:bifunctional metallophosphatase/5'-nucleotidase [Nocardia sp. NPDC127579]|uniref:bifunctional metallophosphatase/5'-nucleotidase n=1 Tax=Nocardia sp. NPDC127579 TaxID=3345402 RepID=UPI00363B415D
MRSSRAAAMCAGLLSLVLLAGCTSGSDETPPTETPPLISTGDLPDAQPGEVHLFGFNDFHGNLEPPKASNGQIAGHAAGGAAYLATHLARLRAAYPDSAVLLSGDNIGASPLVSSLFHDEPTVNFLNSVRPSASAVGNHEFDDGVLELARMQRGGCALDGCSPGAPFTGAAFPYLAANVADANGQLPPGLRAWTMLELGGHKIGVVGTVTPETAQIVFPEGIHGYTFGDPAEAINRQVPDMRAAGAEVVVGLVHDGGKQADPKADYNGCANISANVPELARRTDPAVRVLMTAHSHQPYVCEIDGKVVTQAASYGRLVTDVTLRFDGGDVAVRAVNRVVTREVTPDPATVALIDFYAREAAPRAGRVVGTATESLPKQSTSSPESPLGNVIADAMLATTAGPAQAVAAFMNPGGVRADIGAGPITFGGIYEAQPFGNQVVTLALTGRQILDLLEQQWSKPDRPLVLSVAGLSYTYDDAAPTGHKVVDGTVRIGDQPLNEVAKYRISTNNFLASGGDGFTGFTKGTELTVGLMDLDAFEAYLTGTGPISLPPNRIQRR